MSGRFAAQVGGVSASTNYSGFGVYLDDRTMWAGTFFDAGATHQRGPVWFYLARPEPQELQRLTQLGVEYFGTEEFSGWNGVLLPLPLVAGSSAEGLAASWSQRIKDLWAGLWAWHPQDHLRRD